MRNIVAVTFTDDMKAYEALSDLKNRIGTSEVISAGIIENVDGNLIVKDGFVLGDNEDGHDRAIDGGIIGGLLGVLGGPLGLLLGAGLGGLTGTVIDKKEAYDKEAILADYATKLQNNKLILIMLVQEENKAEFDSFFSHYDAETITREDFINVQAEVYKAEAIEKELAKEARKKMIDEKRDSWKEMAEEKQKEISERINKFRSRK